MPTRDGKGPDSNSGGGVKKNGQGSGVRCGNGLRRGACALKAGNGFCGGNGTKYPVENETCRNRGRI